MRKGFNQHKNDKMFHFLVRFIKRSIYIFLCVLLTLVYVVFVLFLLAIVLIIYSWIIYGVFRLLLLGYGPMIILTEDGTLIIYIFPIIIITKWY